MKVSGIWIDRSATQAVCRTLEHAGYQALFVGGCVRNALMGVDVNDIDIATDALPENVTKLAENAGFRVVPTGFDHGTVTVVVEGVPHEVTTFRRDVQTDGRHAVVAFSADVQQDAARRDFTMNALYARPDGQVVDPLNGLPDLLARRVRFVGGADQRIHEDYLRILRFFRFHAWYGDPAQGLDAEGLAGCAANIAGLETLSAERVGTEMRKLLSARDPAPAVAAMAMSGVLGAVLPGAVATALPVFLHLAEDVPTSWVARLAVLGGDDPTQRLRLSRSESNEYRLVRDAIGDLHPPARLGYSHGSANASAIILARAAVFETDPPQGWAQDVAFGAAASFPVTAADLMPDLQGPALGEKLRELEQAWIKAGFRPTKRDLLG